MDKIIIKNNEEYKILNKKEFEKEKILKLECKNILEEIFKEDLVFLGEEFKLYSDDKIYKLDLCYINKKAEILIVETKLLKDTRTIRENIGQIFEYTTLIKSNIENIIDFIDEDIDIRNNIEKKFKIDINNYKEYLKENLELKRIKVLYVTDYFNNELQMKLNAVNEELKNIIIDFMEIKNYIDNQNLVEEVYKIRYIEGKKDKIKNLKMTKKEFFDESSIKLDEDESFYMKLILKLIKKSKHDQKLIKRRLNSKIQVYDKKYNNKILTIDSEGFVSIFLYDQNKKQNLKNKINDIKGLIYPKDKNQLDFWLKTLSKEDNKKFETLIKVILNIH
ncbi:hypothetical protein WG909_02155 [Peptostreptococcaceae bacterium AGR-M142]